MSRPPKWQRFAPASAEWVLLLACARTRLDSRHRGSLLATLEKRIDWTRFLTLVSRHRLEALACSHLSEHGQGKVPAEAECSLRELAQSRGHDCLRYVGHLIGLMDAFSDAGICAIPYKGPTLGSMAYGNFALRSFVDLDFILPQKHLLRAARLLIDQGLAAYPDPTAPENARFLARFHPGQYAFISEPQNVQVELHTEHTLRYLPVPMDWDEVTRRVIRVSFGGREVRTFSIEDTLILLCVHGAKHFWERLSWICDIAELVQSPRGVDWAMGEELARRSGTRRMWLLGLALANRVLDAPLPREVLGWIEEDAAVGQLCRQIEARLVGKRQTVRSVPDRLLFRLRSHASLGVGARQCLRTAFHPTEHDWQFCKLPDWATPLYLAVRPWRLFREHGLGIRPRPLPELASFQPTPHEVVETMLRIAGVCPGDVLYDLGCGDGRIVIAAAKRFGVRAVGVDIDARRIAEARAAARRSGIEHLVEFRHEDARSVDLTAATVVTLYLSESGVLALSAKLREQLPAGARVVSRDASVPGWPSSESHNIKAPDSDWTASFYLWRISRRSGVPAENEDVAVLA
jgi:SAM-dependent methyltransferase